MPDLAYLPSPKDNHATTWQNLLALCESRNDLVKLCCETRNKAINLRQELHKWRKSNDRNRKFATLVIRAPNARGCMIVDKRFTLEELGL